MYQINSIPIALYDASDCFLDIAIDTKIDCESKGKDLNIDNETPVSIKIIPQVVIPIHDCEVIYYEPNQTNNGTIRNRIRNRLRNRPINDDSLNLYKLCITVICACIIVLSLSSILYNPIV
jgi:hypothetical protein